MYLKHYNFIHTKIILYAKNCFIILHKKRQECTCISYVINKCSSTNFLLNRALNYFFATDQQIQAKKHIHDCVVYETISTRTYYKFALLHQRSMQ